MLRTTIVYGAIALLLIVSNGFFSVDETQFAIVVQLGKPVRTISEPGLHFKIPFLQSSIFFDNRLLDYDADPRDVITKDKKTLLVDNYSKWLIVDPLLLYQSVRNENGAQARLDDIIYSELRVELGKHTLAEIISTKRKNIMFKVVETSNSKAKEYGIKIVDIRIKRADLPPENEKAVYQRMQAERQRVAKGYRSEGAQQAQELRSQAEKEKEIILAEAYQKAQVIMGEGDAARFAIYEEAFKKDPQLFKLVKSLEAYDKIIRENTSLILSPDSEMLKYITEKR